jgi:hypothetical protein
MILPERGGFESAMVSIAVLHDGQTIKGRMNPRQNPCAGLHRGARRSDSAQRRSARNRA